jgi:hypothetical protein
VNEPATLYEQLATLRRIRYAQVPRLGYVMSDAIPVEAAGPQPRSVAARWPPLKAATG